MDEEEGMMRGGRKTKPYEEREGPMAVEGKVMQEEKIRTKEAKKDSIKIGEAGEI